MPISDFGRAVLSALIAMTAVGASVAPALAAEPEARAAAPTTAKPAPIRRVEPTKRPPAIKPGAVRPTRIYDTKLQIVKFGGEFEQLGDEWTVTSREALTFQWTTEKTNAASGRWEVRNVNDSGTVVAEGVSAPAPQTSHFQRFTIAKDKFLFASPPQYNTEFQVTIRPYTSSNEPAGAASNVVKITQLSENNIPPPTQFGDGAHFPSVALVSVNEQVRQMPLTQIYSTYADVKVRVKNNFDRQSDPMWLTLKDKSLLFRQTAAPLSVPELSPGASKVYTIRVKAILPPARSQTPQEQQVSTWRQQRYDRCGPEFTSILDWRGPQSQTPMDAHRESVLPLEGWADYHTKSTSLPVCTAKQCVNLCEMEKSIRSQLDGKVVGYSFVIGGPSSPKFGAGGKARTSADGTAVDFAYNTPITVASVSKWITALAAIRILNHNGADIDDTVGDFYPDDWNVGSYFRNVTFSQFLSQRSGIMDYGNVTQSYAKLKSFFEQPVANNWTASCTGSDVKDPPNAVNPSRQGVMPPCYSNYNFGVLRILLPAVAGLPVDNNPSTRSQTLADQYEQLVRQNVFERVGQMNAGCRPRGPVPHAFAYKYPGDEPGYDWGDVRLRCGDAGWYVSAEDMAKALYSINARDGRILEEFPNSEFDIMRQRGLGIDVAGNTEMEKNGAWGGDNDQLITTSAAIFGPVTGPNVIGVLFVNSDISGGPGNVRTVLENAYNNSVKPK